MVTSEAIITASQRIRDLKNTLYLLLLVGLLGGGDVRQGRVGRRGRVVHLDCGEGRHVGGLRSLVRGDSCNWIRNCALDMVEREEY